VATDTPTAREPSTEVLRVAGAHALVVAVPVLLLGLLLLPLWLAPVVAVAVAVAVTALRCRNMDARVGAALGARPIDPADAPRLAGVADSASMAVGVASPRLHVLDDPARNAVVWGSGAGPASIALTSGLLEAAERIELEGIVARLLTDVREGVIEAPTAATALFGALAGGPLSGLVASLARADEDERRVVVADMAAARATQYPPGAVAALERVREGSTGVARSPRPLQALWYAAPAESAAGDAFAVHPPLADRIDLLREL
jgi:Zn-dependent protease with chaperone function